MIAVVVSLARWRWLLPLSWALAIWWALMVDPHLIQGRFLNAAIQGVQAIMFIAPATAVAGVLAGASVRKNGRRFAAGSRSQTTLTVGVCAVHSAIALTALTSSSTMVSLSAGASGTDGWQLIGLGGLTAAGASALGQSLGRWLSDVVAAPVALLGSYVVLAFPRTFSEPLWLRHLVFVDSCCNSPDQVDPRVLAAIALMATATVAAGLLTTLRGRRLVLGAATGVVVLALSWSVSASLVRDLDWSPATARTGTLECAGAGGAEVCVWPENAAALPELTAMWSVLTETAREHDLGLTPVVSERADGQVVYGSGLISLTPQTPAEAFPEVLVIGALPSIDPCVVDGTMDSRIDNAWLTLARWWISSSGNAHPGNLIDPPYDYLDVPADALDERLRMLLDTVRTCDTSALP